MDESVTFLYKGVHRTATPIFTMPCSDQALARLALGIFTDLRALRTCPGPGLPRRGIQLTLTRRRSLPRGEVRGTAAMAVHGGRRRKGGVIRLRLHPGAERIGVLVLVLHELTHLALPAAENHGALFRQTLAAAASEAWNIDLSDDLDWDGEGEGYRGIHLAIGHKLFWRTIKLRARHWWARLKRKLGAVERETILPKPADALLMDEHSVDKAGRSARGARVNRAVPAADLVEQVLVTDAGRGGLRGWQRAETEAMRSMINKRH